MSIIENYYQDIWNQVKAIIKDSQHFEPIVFTSYLEPSSLAYLNEDKATIVVPMYFQKLVLNQEIEFITATLNTVIHRNVLCEVFIEKELQEQAAPASPVQKIMADNVNPEQNFDNFIVGPSNKESHSAALACAYNPGRFYNPLFIYGSSGLGKTHLLNAIGNYVKKASPQARVYYTSSSDFVSRVVESIRDNSIEAFKSEMNKLDLLLVDDIQFLAGKEKSHEVFFHIFNELVSNRSQIIITSDRVPTEIKGLENRLISRFSSGLSVGVDSPEFETAKAILKMKLLNQSVDDSMIDDAVLDYLATNFAQDVRMLEGALNRLIFFNIEFSNQKNISLETALSAFKNQVTFSDAKELSISKIKKVVADYYGLTKQQLASKNRTKSISNARQIAIYLCRKHLDISFVKIGQEFGKRDHSTIISSVEKVEKSIRDDAFFAQAVAEIEAKLN